VGGEGGARALNAQTLKPNQRRVQLRSPTWTWGEERNAYLLFLANPAVLTREMQKNKQPDENWFSKTSERTSERDRVGLGLSGSWRGGWNPSAIEHIEERSKKGVDEEVE